LCRQSKIDVAGQRRPMMKLAQAAEGAKKVHVWHGWGRRWLMHTCRSCRRRPAQVCLWSRWRRGGTSICPCSGAHACHHCDHASMCVVIAQALY
jgi:hypothetical protein